MKTDRSSCLRDLTSSDYGLSWDCEDSSCTGYMTRLPNGSYTCIDDACYGTSYMIYSEGEAWECFDPACQYMTWSGSSWDCNNYECSGNLATRIGNVWQCNNDTDCSGGIKYYDRAQERFVCDPTTTMAKASNNGNNNNNTNSNNTTNNLLWVLVHHAVWALFVTSRNSVR